MVWMILFGRIKLQTLVWRCSGSPEGSSYACSLKMPPAPAGGASLLEASSNAYESDQTRVEEPEGGRDGDGCNIAEIKISFLISFPPIFS
jgi:hypothetical protein